MEETWTAGRWITPAFDRLIHLTRVELEKKKHEEYYAAAVRIIVVEAPAAVIVHEQRIFVE